jgi:hypothetical protein
MTFIYEHPMSFLLAILFLLTAAGAAWRGAQQLAKGLRHADHPAGSLWVVRGLRGVIVAVGMAALGGGVLLASKGLLVFGAIFLGEELYETGVVLLALRAGLRASAMHSSARERISARKALDGYASLQG